MEPTKEQIENFRRNSAMDSLQRAARAHELAMLAGQYAVSQNRAPLQDYLATYDAVIAQAHKDIPL